MSTKIEAENIVQSLLNGVNEVTGNQDTNLTDGINSLIEGYGQGGSGDEGCTDYTPLFSENTYRIILGEVINLEDDENIITLLEETFDVKGVFGIKKQLYNSSCYETQSATSLAASINCNVGDLVIASIATRDTLTVSNGWTLISTSNVNSTDTYGQRLSFAYKYAESTSESITVTQASAQRLYINMVSLQGATGFVDNGFTYVNSNTSSITVPKSEGLVLFACTCTLWSTSSPYPLWTCSNDSILIQLGTSTQSRLVVSLDETEDTEVTFTSAADNTTLIAGSLTIQGMTTFTEITTS